MKSVTSLLVGLSLLLTTLLVQAAPAARDCMLEGTVQQGDEPSADAATVKFHSVSRYNGDSNCRVRRNEKLEFKLPADPRVQQAPDGAPVKYRYRTDEDGSSKAELISIGA